MNVTGVYISGSEDSHICSTLRWDKNLSTSEHFNPRNVIICMCILKINFVENVSLTEIKGLIAVVVPSTNSSCVRVK